MNVKNCIENVLSFPQSAVDYSLPFAVNSRSAIKKFLAGALIWQTDVHALEGTLSTEIITFSSTHCGYYCRNNQGGIIDDAMRDITLKKTFVFSKTFLTFRSQLNSFTTNFARSA